MDRLLRPDGFRRSAPMTGGLTEEMLSAAAAQTYRVLDAIDIPLLEHAERRLAEVVELANLSSMIGNVFASAIVKNCGGAFTRAGPHKYQDLRGALPHCSDVEIKVALETNRPKGHLPKAGHYLTVRYVLADETGHLVRGARGDVVWIWEIRLGDLTLDDFDISNTEGDSGKTAVVSTHAMGKKLKLVYFDDPLCPYAGIDRYLRSYG